MAMVPPEIQAAAAMAMQALRNSMLTDFHLFCDKAVAEAMKVAPRPSLPLVIDDIVPDRGELIAVLEPYLTPAARMMKPEERADALADAVLRLLKTNLEKGIVPSFSVESEAGVTSGLTKQAGEHQ